MKPGKITLLLFCWLLKGPALCAQDQVLIDSLTTQLNLAEHDTTRLMIEINIEIARRNMRAGYWDSVAARANALNSSAIESHALINAAYIYKNKGDFTVALQRNEKAISIYQEGLNSTNTKVVKDAIAGIAYANVNIGRIYEDQGDVIKALELYHQSLKRMEEISDTASMAGCLNNIGTIYYNQHDIQKAVECYEKSMNMLKELGDKHGVARGLTNLSVVYMNQKDYEKSLEDNFKGLAIQEEIGDKLGISITWSNMGVTYSKQGDKVRALEYYHKSLELAQEIEDVEGICLALSNIADLQRELGDLAEALLFGTKALKMAKKYEFPRRIKAASITLTKVYKKRGDCKTALEMYELHIQMRDSIKNEKTQKATIRQQTKYEFEKAQLVSEQKEKEAVRIEAEKTSRRDNLQYSVILISLLVIGGLLTVIGRFSIPLQLAEGLIFFSFLIFFEFILVLADPYIENWSGGAPGIKLLFNAGIAALIFPLHSLFETKLKKRLA